MDKYSGSEMDGWRDYIIFNGHKDLKLCGFICFGHQDLKIFRHEVG
jgi:hypothetical protein